MPLESVKCNHKWDINVHGNEEITYITKLTEEYTLAVKMLLSIIKCNPARILQRALQGQKRRLNVSCQVEELASRSLLCVKGAEVLPFLQGLVTNDMRHLQDSCPSLYTMFLNNKGRVLYDSIIYKTGEEDSFLVECDHTIVQDLAKHLKMFRVRKKIDIDVADEEWKLWAIFDPKEIENSNSDVKSVKQDQIVPCTIPNIDGKKVNTYFSDLILGEKTVVYSDPRLSSLGCRVIARVGEDLVKPLTTAGVRVDSSPLSYRTFRYRLGIGEGVYELPIGKCFPLEVNCDYLHGVSFHKGCYIGQELTARTHHTGVVRKRLMPLMLLSEASDNSFPIDTPIEAVIGDKTTVIGKLRGLEKNSGLGLMRIVEALDVGQFNVGNIIGQTVRPFWWPQELPKERADSGTNKRG